MRENEIIKKFFAPLSKKEKGALNLNDDAAVLNYNYSKQLVITSDCLVSGVHFFETDPPELIARKCLGVNISDLGAMGAKPKFFLLSAAWPKDISDDWLSKFSNGLKVAQKDWNIILIGGDTVSTPGPMTLSITALGEVSKNTYLSRKGALIGDDIYVTGTIGDAFLGLEITKGKYNALSSQERLYLQNCYWTPKPRHEVSMDLISIATSATDVSDGLIKDLKNILNASNVSAQLTIMSVPHSLVAQKLLRKGHINYIDLILGGDDYELLFTAPEKSMMEISSISKKHSVPITKIGKIINLDSSPSLEVLDDKMLPIKFNHGEGFDHF